MPNFVHLGIRVKQSLTGTTREFLSAQTIKL